MRTRGGSAWPGSGLFAAALLSALDARADAPLLLDPAAVRGELGVWVDRGEGLKAAEAALLLGDPARALELLARTPPDPATELRRVRLELDAYVALQDERAAIPRLRRLEDAPGWEAHVRRRTYDLEDAQQQRTLRTLGLVLFAGAMALLLGTGGRELLRLRRETWALALLTGGAVIVMALESVVLARAVGVLGLSSVALVHAASASVRRMAPAPKGRAFLVALLLLGLTGAALAITTRLPAQAFFELFPG